MSPSERHVRAATGYLDLGLPLEANDELEQIEPGMRTLSDVLIVRVGIYRALEKWELMEVVARQLCRVRPDEPDWPLTFASAVRHIQGPQKALAALAQVANRFPESGAILYDLARYAAQLGHCGAARARLTEAIKLDPGYQRLAQDDADLAALL